MEEKIRVLMHKDIRVADVLFVDNHPVEVKELYNNAHLPPGVDDSERFVLWLEGRNLPFDRPFVRRLMDANGIKSGSDFAGICHAVSLTDCYWFADESEIGNGWGSVSPWKNKWDESGEALFVGHPEAAEGFDCPDFGTGGYLPKVWVREPDNIFLLKRDGANGMNVFAEIAASEVAEALNVSHVPYFFSITAGEVCSGCQCIVQSDFEELVPFSLLAFAAGGVEHLQEFVTKQGIAGEFARMQVFDFLIGNWNRSLEDIAIVRNPETLEVYGMAPLYDHGDAFVDTESDEELQKMIGIAKTNMRAMGHIKLDIEDIIGKMNEIKRELELGDDVDPVIERFRNRALIYNNLVDSV